MPTVLTFDTIQSLANSQAPCRVESVQVPELEADGIAYLAELTAHEREQRIEVAFAEFKEATKQEDNSGIRAYIVAGCLCDESRKFIAASPLDLRKLAASLNALKGDAVNAVRRLADKAAELNALGQSEDIEKN